MNKKILMTLLALLLFTGASFADGYMTQKIEIGQSGVSMKANVEGANAAINQAQNQLQNQVQSVQNQAQNQMQSAQKQVKKTKEQIKKEKRDEIRKQIFEKESELKTLRKTTAMRAADKRPLIKDIEREIKELNAEYQKVK